MEQRPSFSLVIPTYNRPRQLAACLNNLAHLNYPSDRFEIIVVNDGGDVGQIANLPKQNSVLFYDQANAGPAAARNNGAAKANADFLAFLDDDCLPDPEWLTCLAAQLQHSPDVLVGGRTINALTHNPYATASQLLIDYLYGYYNQGQDGPRFFTSNNFALSAKLFEEMGGFDHTFALAAGEDRDFCYRWRLAGKRMLYVPEAIVYHAHHLTFRTFWRQHIGYGRGAYHFHQRRRLYQQGKAKLEPLSFYTNLNLYSFRAEKQENGRLVTAVLLFITQLANTLGYIAQYRRESS
jgi:GT2 family glycosyltransferase